jgi:hypothetical protein
LTTSDAANSQSIAESFYHKGHEGTQKGKKMKIRLGFSLSALLAILAIPAICFAQGVRYDDVALLDTGRPVQGATVTVCGSGSTGTPCTTPTPIFSDSTLSTPITQPGFQSAAQGNFFFYAACGKYDISITGNGITGRTKKDVQLGPCDSKVTASVKRYAVSGTVPTCSIAGAGTGATCSVAGTDGAGILVVNTGTTPSSSGTITLTYSALFGANGTACVGSLLNSTSPWNARASLISVQQTTTVSWAWNWDNNASALTASQSNAYDFTYVCVGRN